MLGVRADRQATMKGDSIYNRLLELSLRDSIEALQREKDAALAYFSAHELISTMTRLVDEHRQGAESNDDLTMLCLMGDG